MSLLKAISEKIQSFGLYILKHGPSPLDSYPLLYLKSSIQINVDDDDGHSRAASRGHWFVPFLLLMFLLMNHLNVIPLIRFSERLKFRFMWFFSGRVPEIERHGMVFEARSVRCSRVQRGKAPNTNLQRSPIHSFIHSLDFFRS